MDLREEPMEELMIKVDNVSKQYKLGQIGGTTLRDELQRRKAKRRGLDDPTRLIGAKTYEKGETFMALDGVSFEVKKGERVGIIGHNGAGKSTLLKLLSRVTAPTDGMIGLNGRVASMLEVGTGFHQELTGRENIYMNGAILGMTQKEIDAKIEDIIDFSECRKFIDTPVKRYSSGMYVKLAFSVAAHLDSEIMIMDEVLAVGDMAFQNKCLGKMNDVSREEGRTILYVSHNMNTIRQLCDRVIVINHGKIVFDGDVEAGISKYMEVSIDTRTYFDFALSKRSHNALDKTEMKSLEILNRDTNHVLRGEWLDFNLKLLSKDTINDIYLRMEIMYADRTMAGTMFTERPFSAATGEELELTMSLDTSNFAPGFYTCIALLHEMNEVGGQVAIERIEPAMTFEVMPNEGEIVWMHRYWGHARFNDMRVNNIDRYSNI